MTRFARLPTYADVVGGPAPSQALQASMDDRQRWAELHREDRQRREQNALAKVLLNQELGTQLALKDRDLAFNREKLATDANMQAFLQQNAIAADIARMNSQLGAQRESQERQLNFARSQSETENALRRALQQEEHAFGREKLGAEGNLQRDLQERQLAAQWDTQGRQLEFARDQAQTENALRRALQQDQLLAQRESQLRDLDFNREKLGTDASLQAYMQDQALGFNREKLAADAALQRELQGQQIAAGQEKAYVDALTNLASQDADMAFNWRKALFDAQNQSAMRGLDIAAQREAQERQFGETSKNRLHQALAEFAMQSRGDPKLFESMRQSYQTAMNPPPATQGPRPVTIVQTPSLANVVDQIRAARLAPGIVGNIDNNQVANLLRERIEAARVNPGRMRSVINEIVAYPELRDIIMTTPGLEDLRPSVGNLDLEFRSRLRDEEIRNFVPAGPGGFIPGIRYRASQTR